MMCTLRRVEYAMEQTLMEITRRRSWPRTRRTGMKRWGKARAAIGEVGRAAARQPQLSLALDPDLIVTPCGTYTKMVKQPRAPPRPSTHSHSHSQTQTQTRLRRLLHPGAAQENQRNSLLHLAHYAH